MATCIPRVDGLSTDPRVWGVTKVTKPVQTLNGVTKTRHKIVNVRICECRNLLLLLVSSLDVGIGPSMTRGIVVATMGEEVK